MLYQQFEGPSSNRLGAIKFAHARYDGDGVRVSRHYAQATIWLGRKNYSCMNVDVITYRTFHCRQRGNPAAGLKILTSANHSIEIELINSSLDT